MSRTADEYVEMWWFSNPWSMKYYTAAVCLGWPSFSDLMKEDSITESDDFSIGMHRLEVACSQVNYNSRFYSFIDLHAHLSVHLSLFSPSFFLLLYPSGDSTWFEFRMLFSLYSSLLFYNSDYCTEVGSTSHQWCLPVKFFFFSQIETSTL